MRRRRVTIWVLVLAAVAALVAGVLLWLRRADERARCTFKGVVDEVCLTRSRLVARWGPKLYSEHDEEVLVRDFFQGRRDGFFLDVGAAHYMKDSNTFYLEERLGWSGIAIDANAEFAADYAKHRPRSCASRCRTRPRRRSASTSRRTTTKRCRGTRRSTR